VARRLKTLVAGVNPFRRGHMPFTSMVPGIVLLFGLIASVAIAAIGVNQLKIQTDRNAALRSRLLSETLAERLSATSQEEHTNVVQRAAIRSGAEIVLVHESGKLLVDGSINPPTEPGIAQLLVVREGETETSLGRARFNATRLSSPFEELSVVTFVAAPRQPVATESMVRSVAGYSAILLGIAALVALALARDMHADVVFLSRRIHDMAHSDAAPTGSEVPVRTIDDVGSMTNSFNDLVQRFGDAQRTYRDDLSLAVTIEQDKSEFLAALSHELKTPLNVILGFADVLLAEVEGPLTSEAEECLRTIRGSGTHLKALIKDILDLSALESGEMTLARSASDVYAIASEVVAEHRVTAREKDLELRLEGDHAEAWADPIRVRQIVGNLVGNAVKFTHKGHVIVRVDKRGESVTIVVTDTGPGIATGDQSAVFEDFSQVGDLKARGAGTGLGLAITRRLVRMHEGSIRLQSELGKGATFTITLPTVQAAQGFERPSQRPSGAMVLESEGSA